MAHLLGIRMAKIRRHFPLDAPFRAGAARLRTLADRGVYVAYDEFKGRRPAVRGSATFHFSDRDFDSPLQPWQYFELTGGSRGRPTRVGQTLGLITDLAVLCALMLDAQGRN